MADKNVEATTDIGAIAKAVSAVAKLWVSATDPIRNRNRQINKEYKYLKKAMELARQIIHYYTEIEKMCVCNTMHRKYVPLVVKYKKYIQAKKLEMDKLLVQE